MDTTAEAHRIKRQRETRTPNVIVAECTCGADFYIHAGDSAQRTERTARRHSAHRREVAAKSA